MTTTGIVFRVHEALYHLPANVAMKVVAVPEVARLPGASPELLGVALVDGEMVPVIAIGDARSAMLVCSYLGERVGLVGMEVVSAGRVDRGEAKEFDVAGAVAKVREGRWAV